VVPWLYMISEKRRKHLQKLADMKRGKPLSNETKQKISLATKGRTAWNKGKTGIYSEETLDKLRNAPKRSGEDHHMWKGDDVGYQALHVWVNKHWGKANKCEHCGLNELPEGKKRYFDWATREGVYNRKKENWIMLCRKCHKNHDLRRK